MDASKRNMVLLDWLNAAKHSDAASIFWSGGYEDPYGAMEGMLALGAEKVSFSWDDLDLGHRLQIVSIAYDAKNDVERALHSENADLFHRPNLELIEPESWEMLLRNGELIQCEDELRAHIDEIKRSIHERILSEQNRVSEWDGKVKIKHRELVPDLQSLQHTYSVYFDNIGSGSVDTDLINRTSHEPTHYPPASSVNWESNVSMEQYCNTIEWIKSKIVEGDFYEMNYCISFEATCSIDPYWVFYVMAQVSAAPMMCFVKRGNYFLMSSSMERYLTRIDTLLVSQPIKGTAKNTSELLGISLDDLGRGLYQSVKDRAENTMIVDLVRNDLSRVCIPGSVIVPELCGIYAFPHVLQMISTVAGKLKEGILLQDILRATFPMGSMTGAPKIEVMKQCETIENFRRGMYSGSVGWKFGNHLDLNVVIRALQYNAHKGELQYAVGGAITIDSLAEEEYRECLAKAEAMLKTLSAAGYSTSNL